MLLPLLFLLLLLSLRLHPSRIIRIFGRRLRLRLLPALPLLHGRSKHILIIHRCLLRRLGTQIHRRLLSSRRAGTTWVLALEEVVVTTLALLLALLLILLERGHETAATTSLLLSIGGLGFGLGLGNRVDRFAETFVPVIAALLSLLALGCHLVGIDWLCLRGNSRSKIFPCGMGQKIVGAVQLLV